MPERLPVRGLGGTVSVGEFISSRKQQFASGFGLKLFCNENREEKMVSGCRFARLVHSSVHPVPAFGPVWAGRGSALPDRAQSDTSREAGLNGVDPETLGVFPMGTAPNTSMALFDGPYGLSKKSNNFLGIWAAMRRSSCCVAVFDRGGSGGARMVYR